MGNPLLGIKGLKKYFPLTKGIVLRKTMGWIKAVDGVDFVIDKGETFGLVGESGCGKTTIAKVILMLERPTVGSILFEGKDVWSQNKTQLRWYRRSVQAVFQDPFSSLSPRMRVGNIIAEPIVVNTELSKKEINKRVVEVLRQVGLSPDSASFYPHEFSGGQRQRIAIARALASNPQCIILDEPVSALDVSIRAQTLNLLSDLQQMLGLSYLMIAHDLAAVRYLSKFIGAMYVGKLVEVAESQELYSNPLHPYTQALFSAVLPFHPDAKRNDIILSGEVPDPLVPLPGCCFQPRCIHARSVCSESEPPLEEVADIHKVACYLYT